MKMPLRAVHNLIRVAASVSLLGVVAATQPGVALAACSRTATATSGTLDWSLTSSWSGGLVPTAADDVCLPTGTETVKLDNTTVAAANSIVVSLGSKLQIGDGAATTLTVATTIANDGTLQIGKTGNVNLAQLVVTSGILLNNPTGTTQTLGTASQLDVNLTNLGTFTATGPVSFGKANSTINNSGTWTNTSQVDMSGGAGQSVNVNGGSFGGSQNFVMSGGTFDHTGGTVSEVILRGVTLKPESPTGGGTFIVAISGNTLATDISAGETVIVAGGYTTQDGVLGSAVDRINNGTLILRSDGAPHTGKVVFTAGAKLTNNGTITSSNSNLLGGDARVLEAPVINNGTINVNYDLDFDQALATIVQGSGTTSIAAGKTLDTTGSAGTFTLNGGALTGSGILTANVLNSGGTVSPGSSPGTLLVDGGYTQNAGGTLAIEIGGTTAGTDSDKLLVTGTATLAGTLALTTINAFSPSLSFSYVYLSAPVVTGSFSPVTGTNAGGGKTYVPSYSGIEATLTVTGPTVTRKPDGQIALGTGAFIGNNVYNMDGSGQTKSKTAGKGVTVKFTIKLQNDGSAKDRFNVQATGADKTGFTFKCMKGTVDITNAINLGAFNTNDIKAGTSVKITCSVKIGSAATHGSQVGKLLTIVSINDTSQKDAVRLVVVRS